MENTEIKVYTSEKEGETIVRTGAALPVFSPQIVSIKGILSSPLDWLKKKVFDYHQANIQVNREKLTITLTINETDHFKTTIVGELTEDERFKSFEINAAKYYTPNDLGDMLRKNKALFENRDDCSTVVNALKDFKAKVNKQVESMKTDRGDYDSKKSQAIDSNIPKSFNLLLPIYKGMDKKKFEVLIHIRAEDLTCTLYSSDVHEIKNDIRDELFDSVIKDITEFAPNLVIIES